MGQQVLFELKYTHASLIPLTLFIEPNLAVQTPSRFALASSCVNSLNASKL
jgi:hypothetical protein